MTEIIKTSLPWQVYAELHALPEAKLIIAVIKQALHDAKAPGYTLRRKKA